MSRYIGWFSTGGASAVMAKMLITKHPDAEIVFCETNNEDEDNYRFMQDVEKWLGVSIRRIKNDKYDSVPELWEKRKYMSGIKGAICSTEMKFIPRINFQQPDDIHAFGYTADKRDINRFNELKKNFFEQKFIAPLITSGINKRNVLAMLENAGIKRPRTYDMGFPNANCLKTGCCKAQSDDYWQLFRQRFPERFKETVEISRKLGVKLVKKDEERYFIDELPIRTSNLKPIAPRCDFMCAIAEREMSDAESDAQG